MEIILASQSPRRKELLSQLGYRFETVHIDCDESFPVDMPVSNIAGYLSEKKSNAFGNLPDGKILITADTIVALGNKVLGKPADRSDAFQMLKELSGKIHQVYTGITVRTSEKTITVTDVANVEFDYITDSECDFYLTNFQPFDKAGSYGVQDWLGMAKIRKIEGSFYTVMGLPTHLLYGLLQELAPL